MTTSKKKRIMTQIFFFIIIRIKVILYNILNYEKNYFSSDSFFVLNIIIFASHAYGICRSKWPNALVPEYSACIASFCHSIQYSDFIRGFLSYFRNPLSIHPSPDSLQQKCLFSTSVRISIWFSYGKPYLCPNVRGKSIIKGRSNHSLCNL